MLALLFAVSPLCAQSSSEALPPVFKLGDHEAAFEGAKQKYSQTLLEVSGYDTKAAFSNWMEMMKAMDNYAQKVKYDINGVKLWLHVFWGANGQIAHMGYLLRPDSRNVEEVELAAFLKSFMNKYTFPATSSRPFSHYTGANFPVFSQRVEN